MMTVLIAENTPPAVRGMLKRWFVEPRPNVFVGTLNRRAYQKTIEFVRRHSQETGMLMICSDPNCQGYIIDSFNKTSRKRLCLSGLCLIAEKWIGQLPLG